MCDLLKKKNPQSHIQHMTSTLIKKNEFASTGLRVEENRSSSQDLQKNRKITGIVEGAKSSPTYKKKNSLDTQLALRSVDSPMPSSYVIPS